MSDASGRTLLSLWGIKQKPPENCLKSGIANETDETASESQAVTLSSDPSQEEVLDLPKSDRSADRAKAASQWNSIFSKPKNNTSYESPTSIQESESTASPSESPLRRLTRPLDPRNPFEPSFLHILKAPPDRLKEVEKDLRLKAAIHEGAGSVEKPSLIHTFRVQPEKLSTVKPRIHSFFAKRHTSSAHGVSKPDRKGNSLRPLNLKHPTWSTIHVRPDLTYEGTKYSKLLSKRPRKKIIQKTEDHEWRQVVSSRLSQANNASSGSPLQLPKRALYSSEQLRALAALSKSKQNGDFLAELISATGVPKHFDCGKFEDTMWCEKYAPQKPIQHLLSLETQKIASWAAAQMQKRQKQRPWPPKRKRRNVDDFVVDEDEEDEEDADDILLVSGPCGSGKTSAVYAAAKSLNAFVFEVNCSMKRTGKELSSLLDGISHNHAVHSAKSCIILIDDGDIIYENEAGGFWPTLARFAASSRRPVIITCTDPRRIALSDLGTSIIRLQMPDLVRVTDTAWTIALSEGHLLSKSDVATLVVVTRGDMRRILTHIQFWCQMGIGGLPSGVDWYAKDHEFAERSADRVISEDSWCPSLKKAHDPDYVQTMPPSPEVPPLESLDSYTAFAAALSELDSAFEPYNIEHRSLPEETVSGNGSTILSEWRVPIMRRTLTRPGLTGSPMSYLPKIRDIFADEYSFGTTSDALIAQDIAPYMREIAACDFRRALIMERSLAQNQSARGMRMTRRMWAASGIDSRQYMGYSTSSLRLILSTCMPAHLFELGSQ